MTLNDILIDIHALEEDSPRSNARYGVRSETFYAAYQSGYIQRAIRRLPPG